MYSKLLNTPRRELYGRAILASTCIFLTLSMVCVSMVLPTCVSLKLSNNATLSVCSSNVMLYNGYVIPENITDCLIDVSRCWERSRKPRDPDCPVMLALIPGLVSCYDWKLQPIRLQLNDVMLIRQLLLAQHRQMATDLGLYKARDLCRLVNNASSFSVVHV